jgi:hypothetical protein
MFIVINKKRSQSFSKFSKQANSEATFQLMQKVNSIQINKDTKPVTIMQFFLYQHLEVFALHEYDTDFGLLLNCHLCSSVRHIPSC